MASAFPIGMGAIASIASTNVPQESEPLPMVVHVLSAALTGASKVNVDAIRRQTRVIDSYPIRSCNGQSGIRSSDPWSAMQCSAFVHIFAVITDSEPSDTRMPLTITCLRATGHATGRANDSRVLGMAGIVGVGTRGRGQLSAMLLVAQTFILVVDEDRKSTCLNSS